MLSRGWEHVEAKLVDQRYLSGGLAEAADGRPHYELWQYMVELPGEDGSPIRLTIKEKSFRLRLPAIGGSVPVLVHPRKDKAKFDFDDPRIDAVKANKQEAKAEKERSAARFEAQLSDPGKSTASSKWQAAEKAEAAALSAIEQGDDLSALEEMEEADDALEEARRANDDN